MPGLGWLAGETCTSPALSPDGSTLAVVSDRNGTPRVWLSPIVQSGPSVQAGTPVLLATGEDYVRAVSWSPDG
ncbi:MAG: TolB family protein, partial [Pseudonocardiaceae bacterium]